MMNDPEQRQQTTLRSPPRLFVGDTLDVAENRSPQITEPVQGQLTLVLIAEREADVLVGRRTSEPSRAYRSRITPISPPWWISISSWSAPRRAPQHCPQSPAA